MAPEVIIDKHDYKCDIWSLGVILYVLLCGEPPFKGSNFEEIKKKILEAQPIFESKEWKDISKEAIVFIKKMLNSDPNKRYSAEMCLHDEWIVKNQTPTVIN